jgi:hypothetical protein
MGKGWRNEAGEVKEKGRISKNLRESGGRAAEDIHEGAGLSCLPHNKIQPIRACQCVIRHKILINRHGDHMKILPW